MTDTIQQYGGGYIMCWSLEYMGGRYEIIVRRTINKVKSGAVDGRGCGSTMLEAFDRCRQDMMGRGVV